MKAKKNMLAALLLLATTVAQAQGILVNHLFLHAGFASGNVYTATFPSVATWGLNELTKSNIFESALEYPMFSGEVAGSKLKVENYNMLGFTANELFSCLHPTLKLGYQTNTYGQMNYGVYATAEYMQNLFKTKVEGVGDFEKNALTRALVGGSVFAVIGGLDKPYRVMVEAGCRYSMALGYKGPLAGGKKDIANGLVSHYAVKMTGASALQDFGVYVDLNHFDLLKDKNAKLNGWSVGLMWTVTPGQRENHENYR